MGNRDVRDHSDITNNEILGVIGIIVRDNRDTRDVRDINGNRHNREGYGIRSIIPIGDEVTPCSRDTQGIIEIIE